MPTISSSRLKPSVTPVTALATRLRPRPWNLPSSLSSRMVLASNWPSWISKVMPGGNACRSLPFGPWTSTASPVTLIVTPFGIGIGFFPIRDMILSRSPQRAADSWQRDALPAASRRLSATRVLPNVTEHLAADARLGRLAPGHQPVRRRQDADAETGENRRHLVVTEVHAPAGPADAVDPGDDAFPSRAVLQEDADELLRRPRALRGLFRELEALDVTLGLQDPRNLDLQLRRRDVNARPLGSAGVADTLEHGSDRISHDFGTLACSRVVRVRRTVR